MRFNFKPTGNIVQIPIYMIIEKAIPSISMENHEFKGTKAPLDPKFLLDPKPFLIQNCFLIQNFPQLFPLSEPFFLLNIKSPKAIKFPNIILPESNK